MARIPRSRLTYLDESGGEVTVRDNRTGRVYTLPASRWHSAKETTTLTVEEADATRVIQAEAEYEEFEEGLAEAEGERQGRAVARDVETTTEEEAGFNRYREETGLRTKRTKKFTSLPELAAYLDSQGIDVEALKAEAAVLGGWNDAFLDYYNANAALATAQFLQRHPKPQTTYQQRISAAGFEGMTPEEFRKRTVAPEVFLKGTAADIRKHAAGDAIKDPDTGATRYSNGVLVDDQGVAFDEGNEKQAGSREWLTQMNQASAEKQETLKAELLQYGYITKEQAKAPGLTAEVLDQARLFHINRYSLGGGRPVASEASGTAGSQQPEFPTFDFERLQGEAKNEVAGIWAELYGARPAPEELEAVSRAILSLAAKLYNSQKSAFGRGEEWLTRSEAFEEAVRRTEQEEAEKPQAVYARESFENTTMRDTFIAAASVADTLSKGRA